jgi:hypothetical protein
VTSHAGLLLKVIGDLAETYLCVCAGQIFVKNERFGEWQHLLPYVSPILVVAARLQHQEGWRDDIRSHEQAVRRVQTAGISHTALPTVWEPALDDLIRQQGLNEMHMHLNGSTELDNVWLRALANPEGFFKEIRKVSTGEPVKELYDQIRPGLNAYKIYRYVRIARRLRALLTHAAFARNGADPVSLEDFRQAVQAIRPSDGEPLRWLERGGQVLRMLRPDLVAQLGTDLEQEVLWYMGVLRLLRDDPQPAHASLFHSYLLIIGMVGRLTVQQVEQFGFDQFQKFTMNGLREDVEKAYADRFHQLTGPEGNDLDHLEGRFLPKKKNGDTPRLLRKILRGYAQYHDPGVGGRTRFTTLTRSEDLRFRSRMRLGLVVHFTKARDKDILDVLDRRLG